MAKKTMKNTEKKIIKKNNPEVCPNCGRVHPVRKDLGITATKEELDSFIIINNRVNVAAQAAQPVNVAPNVTPEQIRVFVTAALEAKAEAMALQRQWWNEMFTKYKELPKDKKVFVDFDSGEFYIQTN